MQTAMFDKLDECGVILKYARSLTHLSPSNPLQYRHQIQSDELADRRIHIYEASARYV